MSPAVAAAAIRTLDVYSYVILARVLLSWFVQDWSNPFLRILRALTDPVLVPLQRVLTFGGLDVSPIAVLLGIQLLERLIVSLV